jgi:hypothetical protein
MFWQIGESIWGCIMTFLPDTKDYVWLFNMDVRKLLAKKKTVIESVASRVNVEFHDLELWLCRSSTKKLRKSKTNKFILMP